MFNLRMKIKSTFGLIVFFLLATQVGAQEAELAELKANTQFIFNSLLFLIGGFLVMFMAAGFAMLEAGLVRTKNASMQCMKNIALYSISGVVFWACGYSLMYTGVAADTGLIGTFAPYSWPDAGVANDGSYAVASDWFFQMVFCAATGSIVSGAVAERIKLWPFLLFAAILMGVIYPISASWQWGGGWLAGLGFNDFAGSTLVHSVGGWAALAGILVLGPRTGKYGKDGRLTPIPGSNIPLATLGTFILWLGWFGFNGGSQLALDSNANASDVARIFVNTNLSACGGVIASMILLQLLYKKIDVTIVLNGALAGLVSITAEPLAPSPLTAILIGAVGGVLASLAIPLMDRFKLDDVVGAIPVHLVCGIWGTLIVPLSNTDASFAIQFIGIAAYGSFAFISSAILWLALKKTVGIRVSDEEEYYGMDRSEIGVDAYPEFSI